MLMITYICTSDKRVMDRWFMGTFDKEKIQEQIMTFLGLANVSMNTHMDTVCTHVGRVCVCVC